MADLSSALLSGVEAFAQGAMQEDDITVVLVKRRVET
jgi:serine phosphatase RsbU (regulator of sigma subunit)